jgi:putative inorganic carbon (HCO3(-)) transporter
MINAPINSDGFPHPLQVRVFSFLNSPAPFGTFIISALIPVAALRSRWRWLALAVGFAGLGLSLVRAAWIGWAVSIVVLLARRPKAGRRLGARLVAVPVILLVLVGGPIEHTVVKRLTQSASNGTQDVSLTARISEYETYIPLILRNPVGEGLGSTGTSTKLSHGGQLSSTTGNFDGGFLVIGYNYGLIGSLIILAALGWAISTCRRTCPAGEIAQGCVAVLYGLVAQLFFVDITTGISGVCLWVIVGYVALTATTKKQDTVDVLSL